MKWIPRFSVQRPVSTVMLFVATIVLGLISWNRIPLELLPDTFENGQLWLNIPYADSQPRETEDKVTLPVEDALSDLTGIKMIRSSSSSGRAASPWLASGLAEAATSTPTNLVSLARRHTCSAETTSKDCFHVWIEAANNERRYSECPFSRCVRPLCRGLSTAVIRS